MRGTLQSVSQSSDPVSPIEAFVRDACQLHVDAWVSSHALFAAWIGWRTNHQLIVTGNQQVFDRDLRTSIPSLVSARHDGVRGWRGLQLLAGKS